VKGWAVDARANAPALGTDIFIDDCRESVAPLGTPRPYAVWTCETHNYANAGYEIVIPAGARSQGRYLLQLRMLTQDGRSNSMPTPAPDMEIRTQ
jgi:hypothetical protein